jgi:AcrR family transcriptional regulator
MMPALKKAPSTAQKTSKVVKAAKATPEAKSEAKPEAQARGQAFVRPVLEITLSELAEQGYERLSIPHIAELAGVNKTSIYRRWPSKLELIQEALERAMVHIDPMPDTGSLHGDLLAMARAMSAFTQSSVGTALLRIVFAQESHPQLRQIAIAAQQAAGEKAPWLVIERAVKRGELSPQTDASLLLFTLGGAVLHRVFVEKAPVHEAYLEKLIDLVLYGATHIR